MNTSIQSESPDASKSHQIYLGLGSNQGERDATLRAALDALKQHVLITRVSSVYDTAPLLVTEQPRFHNVACSGRTGLDPQALLRFVKRIEATLGRLPGPRYGPRPIDIDILLYDQLVIRSPALTIPHPGLGERAFVLTPLAEIAPEVHVPGLDATTAELLARLPPADVRLTGHLFSMQG